MEPRLTPRQRAVLDLLVQGRNRDEIAAALVVHPKTVQHHLEALMRHYYARSTEELILTLLARCRAALGAIEERRAERRETTE